MSKIEEMQAKLAILINTAQDYLDKDDLENADKVQKQAQELADKIEKQKALDKLSANIEVPQPTSTESTAKNDAAQTKENASFIRAALKKLSGTKLTEAEDALLLPSTTYPNGANGEGYILPQDIRTKIHEKLRQFKSLREVCGYIKTTALTGSYPIENIDSINGLVDFTDGTDGQDATDFSFGTVGWSLKEKGAFIKVSNTLLALTDNDLIAYIVRVFAKKAVITENAMAKAKLEANKTAKSLSGWAALKESINTDLDPAALYNTRIVTNQDGFNVLDKALDLNGRPVLQPDPTQPTRKLFMGFPVMVYSNAMLASDTTNNVAPVYYGDIEDGVQFVDLDNISFASSKEAGFMSNTTICRLIEWVDVVQADASDKCYCFGKLSLGE
ncbi:phage major capsid protein [uncultured Ruminococcus sp.]|uniref:phage major capsid protein n=1 Tax=uncultured Ruminococcus sp. TaxID=165186 RepID=UPI0025FFF40E|nr:phage major capsid protein [uncultured Ruminococcus sp.]